MMNDQQTGGQSTTQAFMAALQQAEATGDVTALLALHAPDVTLRNLTQQTWEGEAGARAFWETYLGNFEEIRSEFTRTHEAGGLGVMEWTASGQLRGGHPVEYRGVSLIELSGGQVAAFRTYYDSAAFVVAPT
ncbi:nuclear transport factor 2 family protein [Deinococcus caeni]|uniref:SnoaL-like domain-containing protein n=1 Tax=Deinococcus caeni TaxID=569127 RepID=A0ABP9UGF5_9DEIO